MNKHRYLNIDQFSHKTGLNKVTIRFYCSKGLLHYVRGRKDKRLKFTNASFRSLKRLNGQLDKGKKLKSIRPIKIYKPHIYTD